MTTTFSCDYCRGTIDTAADAALIVGVHRRVDTEDWDDAPNELASGEQLTFRYCSQQHLATHMERVPLPPVRVDTSLPPAAVFSCLGVALVALLAGYGAFQLWQDVVRGWF